MSATRDMASAFGAMMGKHLNLEEDVERLRALNAEMLEALRDLVLVCGSTGDAFHDFEEQAEAYQRETGKMRPGKDMPASSGGTEDYEARRIHYNAWVQTKIESARAAIAKAGAA